MSHVFFILLAVIALSTASFSQQSQPQKSKKTALASHDRLVLKESESTTIIVGGSRDSTLIRIQKADRSAHKQHNGRDVFSLQPQQIIDENEEVSFTYFGKDFGSAQIAIFDSEGTLVYQNEYQLSHESIIFGTWNLRDLHGYKVVPGTYSIVLTLEKGINMIENFSASLGVLGY
ncbi:MAG: hypothetical protein JW795_10410 [Chitinivibrionales bacterium]|nr:hypothetical protein [Chitinivibrionales bacterium]